MKDSLKEKILTFLEGKDFTFGGTIEDHIRATEGRKASNASRRCRELEDEGKIEARYVIADGRKVVQYKIKESGYEKAVRMQTAVDKIERKAIDNLILTTMAGICCYSYQKFKVHDKNCAEISKQKTPTAATANTLF